MKAEEIFKSIDPERFCWHMLISFSLVILADIVAMIAVAEVVDLFVVILFMSSSFCFMSSLIIDKIKKKARPPHDPQNERLWLGTTIYGIVLVVISLAIAACYAHMAVFVQTSPILIFIELLIVIPALIMAMFVGTTISKRFNAYIMRGKEAA